LNTEEIFKMAIGLQAPWLITKLEFKNISSKSKRQLNIYINFVIGAKFKDKNGVECNVHDTIKRSWQHLNFFEHECYLHARVPRIITSDGKIQNVNVP